MFQSGPQHIVHFNRLFTLSAFILSGLHCILYSCFYKIFSSVYISEILLYLILWLHLSFITSQLNDLLRVLYIRIGSFWPVLKFCFTTKIKRQIHGLCILMYICRNEWLHDFTYMFLTNLVNWLCVVTIVELQNSIVLSLYILK